MKNLINTVKKNSPGLYFTVLVNVLLALICIPGLAIDDRMLMGVSVWLKPFKFAISTAIYVFTFGYLISLYPFSIKKQKILNGTVAWTLLAEMLIIFYQGARGVRSHYNESSLFDGILYAMMGLLIAINVLIMVYMLIATVRRKLNTTKSIQWSIFLGWLLIIAGSWVGGQMIGQLSHTVGAADGEAGLPFINWSTIAGDLRIAHFFGVHGLQIIPLFAFIVSKKWKASSGKQIFVVSLFALLYALWLGFTFYQAKQGIALLNL